MEPEAQVVLPLDGFTVAVTADRRWDEQAELFVRRGAKVLHGPVMRTLPLGADEGLRAATERLIADPPDVVVANTGIGMRAWLSAAESWGMIHELLDVLASARVLARGPKAAGAALTAGCHVDWSASSEQLEEVVDVILDGGAGPGTSVAVQLDGSHGSPGIDRLRAAGVAVTTIPVYRWVDPEDPGPALRVVQAVADRDVDAVTFTSAPAVERFFAIAGAAGLDDEVRTGLAGPVIAASIGPVCSAALRRFDVEPAVEPARYRLGALIQALTDTLYGRRVEVDLGGRWMVLQGSVALVGGCRVALPTRERGILHALAARPGVVVPRANLMREVWGPAATGEHVLEVAVGRLRRRLAATGVAVETVPRRGYRLATHGPAHAAP